MVMAIENAAMAVSPITWIIIGIVALGAVLALLIIHWDSVWLAIQAFGTKTMGFLSGEWTSFTDGIGGFIDGAIAFSTGLPDRSLAAQAATRPGHGLDMGFFLCGVHPADGRDAPMRGRPRPAQPNPINPSQKSGARRWRR